MKIRTPTSSTTTNSIPIIHGINETLVRRNMHFSPPAPGLKYFLHAEDRGDVTRLLLLHAKGQSGSPQNFGHWHLAKSIVPYRKLLVFPARRESAFGLAVYTFGMCGKPRRRRAFDTGISLVPQRRQLLQAAFRR